jgi:hypothetical protein
MKPHLKLFGFILNSIGLCLLTFGSSLAEMPLDIPKANTGVSDLVPFPLIEKIAIKKAQEKWGQVSPGSPLAACDDDGDIVAYMFPFSIGTEPFPDYSEILSSVKYGRKIAEEGVSAMAETDQQKMREKAKEQAVKSRSKSVSDIDVDIRQVESLANRLAKKLGKEKMMGAGQYGTVIVSARYDRFPVPLYMHYLPPYFYHGDLATKEAQIALSSNSVTLERIYFLERERTQYFEFSSKGRSILVHSYNLAVEPVEKRLTRKGTKVVLRPEMLSRITEEWDKIKKEVGY